MSVPLPPILADAVRRELRYIPAADRADAAQEAWLAYLEGRNPACAVSTYECRERRHRQRESAGVASPGRQP